MYGMVHSAARSMAIDTLGGDAWFKLLQDSNLSRDAFVSNQNYDDDVTFRIVTAIAERLRIGPSELLRQFGVYWIDYAAKSPYGAMFRVGGEDLRTFLHSLNRMHASIHATMPASRMPSFEVLSDTGNRIDLLYVSDREGLNAFVEGLLAGLLDYFGEKGSVVHEATRPDGDVFSIRLEAAAPETGGGETCQ